MDQKELEKKLCKQKLISQEFIEQAFGYWLNDFEEHRSPIPAHLRDEFQNMTFQKFMEWTFNLSDTDTNIDSQLLSETFNDFAFEVVLSLARNEDDLITIKYPGLPRIGDKFHMHRNDPGHQKMNEIIDRCAVKKKGKWVAIKLKFKYPDDQGREETEFDLE